METSHTPSNGVKPEQEELLTIGDAAWELGVSVLTLQRWEKRGKISAQRTIGGHRRFTRSEINRIKAGAR